MFPFGYGLSYTSFEYSDLEIEPTEVRPGDAVTVRMRLSNSGEREGKETVQLYIRDAESSMERPVKEPKGFRKVKLSPGESTTVVFNLDDSSMSFYNPAVKRWVVEPGVFQILIGSSSRDIRLKGRFTVK